ncbi:MAG: extracellular solute-binding protein [Gemmatimonadota bacterium]
MTPGGAARAWDAVDTQARRPLHLAVVAGLAVLTAACIPDDGRAPLIVYSPHGRAMLEVYEARFEAAHPDIDLQWVDQGSQEILDRLRSERANPQADVWWGAPATMFVTGVEDGLLTEFEPTWASTLPDDARGQEARWHGIYLTPEVIAYNSAAIAPEDVPRDWEDVLDPRWADEVLIRDPLASGTMRTIFGMIMHRSIVRTGDTAQGYDWLRRLDAQTKEYVLNPTLLYQKLNRQEGLVTLWDMPDIEALKRQGGYDIDYVFPESGTPLLVDGIGVVKGAPHPEAARELVEFLGSTDEVLHAAANFDRLPARTDIPADELPEALQRAREQIRPEPLDWGLLQERTTEWMRYWDEHIRGRG